MRTRILALAIGLAVTLAKAEAPRRPRGIYANVNISDNINQQTKANPSITESGLQTYFDGLYQSLLANPAVSGLSIQVHWDTLNPRDFTDPKPYDWTYLDPAFNDVAAWNVANPTATKTIQLIVTPGFQTPPWVLAKLNSCDGLFQTPPVTLSSCGKATFTGFKENADGTELPMPWNSTYKSNWKTFLTALATQYGSNSALVSIAVAGPTAASAEMILPNNGNTPAQSGIQPDDMWVKLLTFHYPGKPAYQNTDQAFIDEWNAAIDMYSGIFSGITLVATTGNGLPTLSGTFTVPKDFTAYCKVPADMDCAAETTILSHFADATVGGANAKAVQTSGMEASRMDLSLGINGVKLLSQSTASTSQILGGSQFNTSFSDHDHILQEGCTSKFPPDKKDMPILCSIPPSCTGTKCIPVACVPQACMAPSLTPSDLTSFVDFGDVPSPDLIPPEQAAYNVLNVFFDGTPYAVFFGATEGSAPLNFLQIYSQDIVYATANTAIPAQVVQTSGVSMVTTAQALLNLASQKLLAMAEPLPYHPPVPPCSGTTCR